VSDVESRLARCFAAVFPELDPAAIKAARRGRVPGWDSLASITLVRVIEDEFEISIRLLDLDDLNGFQEFLTYLAARIP
jgi:acyl carrier protein